MTKIQDLHGDALDLAALAGLLADVLTFGRKVHPDDAGKPDVSAVASLLAQRLRVHRDTLEAEADAAARAGDV